MYSHYKDDNGNTVFILKRSSWVMYPKALTNRMIVPGKWGNLGGSLQWRNNGRDGVSNHRRLNCLLNCLFRRRSKKTSKLRVTGLCGGNSPETGQFPAQRANNTENVSIWWRHNDIDEIEWHQTNGKHNSKAHMNFYNLQIPLYLISYIFSRIYSNILRMHVWGNFPSYLELFILWPHTSVYVIQLALIGTRVVRFSISGTLTAVLQYISQRTIYSKWSNSIWI